MYSIGEYSKIAQVSKRLLRYYDEIGLFQPIKVDSSSGHRFYSASQLPTLNRILALKELGLSLDQVQRFIQDDISLEEIQGMLLMKKAELEQQLFEELKRIRTIESRLKQIKDRDRYIRDVVVKEIPAQTLLGMRKIIPSSGDSGDRLFWSVMNALPSSNKIGAMTIILHQDGINSDRTDVEFGRLLHGTSHAPLTIYDGLTLEMRSLPATTMATFIPPTESCGKLLGYNTIGAWVEANHYTFAGPVRLVFLELPKQPGDNNFVTEIQFPICKRTVDLDLLSLS